MTRLLGRQHQVASACDGWRGLASLVERYAAAGGRYFVCPVCFDARKLAATALLDNASVNGTVPLWQWIGDDHAVTFSY